MKLSLERFPYYNCLTIKDINLMAKYKKKEKKKKR